MLRVLFHLVCVRLIPFKPIGYIVEQICAIIWTNCAYNDRSVKFDTQIGSVIRNILDIGTSLN